MSPWPNIDWAGSSSRKTHGIGYVFNFTFFSYALLVLLALAFSAQTNKSRQNNNNAKKKNSIMPLQRRKMGKVSFRGGLVKFKRETISGISPLCKRWIALSYSQLTIVKILMFVCRFFCSYSFSCSWFCRCFFGIHCAKNVFILLDMQSYHTIIRLGTKIDVIRNGNILLADLQVSRREHWILCWYFLDCISKKESLVVSFISFLLFVLIKVFQF